MKKTTISKIAILIGFLAVATILLIAFRNQFAETTKTGAVEDEYNKEWLSDQGIEPPLFESRSIEAAITLADYFVAMLNAENDLTGDTGAINSWNDLFDFGQIYHGDLFELEYSENVYQFDVYGIKGEKEGSARVLINLQGDEPTYFCSYTRYYPYVLQIATNYISLLADGDVKQLARWLSVDGGPDPSDDFVRQAERGLSFYDAYDLHDVVTTGIQFDNEAQRFFCSFIDAKYVPFEVALSFSDGLIMPDRLN